MFQIVMQKVARLAKKLEELHQKFLTEGPSSENMSLEEGLNSLTEFRFALQNIFLHNQLRVTIYRYFIGAVCL